MSSLVIGEFLEHLQKAIVRSDKNSFYIVLFMFVFGILLPILYVSLKKEDKISINS